MYSDWSVFAYIALAVLLFWVGVLNFLVWKQNKFLKVLFPKSGQRDIRVKFEQVLKQIELFEGSLESLREKLSVLEKLSLKHIQRVELLRYNPYNDTGGDQSFTICLLDNQGFGVVITSLHARSGTRIYAKPVEAGKAGKFQFSKEEAEVIRKALS